METIITASEMWGLVLAKPCVSAEAERKYAKKAPKNPSRGKEHLANKLTDEEVLRMRQTFAIWQEERRIGKRGVMASSPAALAREFRTSDTTAREILRGWRRAHVGGPTFDI